MSVRNFSFPARTILVASLMLLGGCKQPTDTAPAAPVVTWGYGTAATYTIQPAANFVIADSISGGRFIFPKGGNGTLVVRRITSGYNVSSGDNAFEVQYQGADTVIFEQKHQTGDLDYLMTYMSSEYVVPEGPIPAFDWYNLPVDAVGNGFQQYALNRNLTQKHAGTGVAWNKTLAAGIAQFKALAFPAGSKRVADKAYFENALTVALDQLVKALPDTMQGRIRAAIAGDMKYTVAVYGDLVKCQYRPFHEVFGWDVREFAFVNGSDLSNVAHEGGHYFHHVLLGNASFKTHAAKGIQTHGLGMPRTRDNVMEEPAFLSEYYLRGTVKSSSPEMGGQFIRFDVSGQTPKENFTDKVDFPSLEGFSVAMFGAMLRKNEIVTDFEGKRRSVPLITSFTIQDAFKLFVRNAMSVEEIRDGIETAVSSAEQTKLSPVLQQLGWNYHVKCHFVDANKKGVKVSDARSVSICDPGRYYLPACGLANPDENCSFNYFYPGRSFLRVYSADKKDSVDVPVEISYTKKTNAEVDLGDIVVDFAAVNPDIDSGVDLLLGADFTFSGTFGSETPPTTISIPTMIDDPRIKISWKGKKFTCDWDEKTQLKEKIVKINGTLADNGRSILTVTSSREVKEYQMVNGNLRQLSDTYTRIDLKDLPLLAFEDMTHIYLYEITGAQAEKCYVAAEYRYVYTPTSGAGANYSLQSVKWNGTGKAPDISVQFY